MAIRQSDVVNVTSVSTVGSAQIVVEYAWRKDMNEAFLDLQKSLASFGQSSDVDELTISQHDPNATPIVTIALTNNDIKDLNALRRTAEGYIRNELIRLEGIAEVRITSYNVCYTKLLRILVIPGLVYSLGLSFVLMSVLKNQAVTFLVILAIFGFSLFYFSGDYYNAFDFSGILQPALYSSIRNNFV